MKKNSKRARPILVTGGAGFIGANFILDWLSRGLCPVVNLDKLTYAGNLGNLASIEGDGRHIFVQGDIGDPDLVRRLLADYTPRAIVNFAAESHVDRSIDSAADFIVTNVVGTFRLLEMCRDYMDSLGGAERQAFRFLHVSTDEVFGSLESGDPAFTEQHRYVPNSPYAASKAGSDHLVRAWHHTYGLPGLITNCSNNYGPFQFPEKLIPLIIHNALRGLPLPIYGDGQQVRDWVYVGDHCAAIRTVLEKGRIGETYNIGGDSEKANIDTVHLLCDILDAERPRDDGRSYRSQIKFVTDRPGHDRRYAINAAKLTRDLGWRPCETFDTGLRKTVRWYLDNAVWVEGIVNGSYREWVAKNYDSR
jgi:dTDP-glucose 4,6-dehydratase